MVPELYEIYLKFKQAKKIVKCPINQENIIVFNIYDQYNVPNELVEEKCEEKTLTITKKQMKIDGEEQKKIGHKSECFKMDIFSLGLVILEMALSHQNPFMKEIKIKDLNRSEKNLQMALEEFITIKKNENSKFLNQLLKKMLISQI